MCGIFGSSQASGSPDVAWLQSAADALKHRGPDGSGSYVSPCGRVRLGHNRLAIVDLTDAGHQPMTSLSGRYTLVFNGEIYNFRDIRRELRSLGWQFRSTGDSEVLLAAFEQWQEGCLARLNGMFSFVVFDRGGNDRLASLFFARDRAGEKPFYYQHSPGRFRFASELKGLPHSDHVSDVALNFYLALGYVPGDTCLFEGVSKLPPAHCGRFFIDSGKVAIVRYWSLPSPVVGSAASEADLVKSTGDLVQDSVRQRLVADVPVGVLLSGGLDSSLIAAAAARASAGPVATFTIAMTGTSLDESHHAAKVAAHLGTNHHVLPLDKPRLDLLDGFSPFIDEPIADSSLLPSWVVFGLARQHVTVALGGDGGDELFGGYTDYTQSLSDARRLQWVSPRVLATVARAASTLPAGVHGRNRLASLRQGAHRQLIWGRPYFDVALRRRVLTGDAHRRLQAVLEAPEQFLLKLFLAGGDPVDKMSRTHFGSILPDDFLVKVDRASMAHSLEVRAPFLDHRLIEFAFGSVPAQWKVHAGQARRLQRALAREWLPPDLDINRKQGFSIPINEWLRVEGADGLHARLQHLPPQIDPTEVERLVRGHLAGRSNGGRLFALIMLSIALENAHKRKLS